MKIRKIIRQNCTWLFTEYRLQCNWDKVGTAANTPIATMLIQLNTRVTLLDKCFRNGFLYKALCRHHRNMTVKNKEKLCVNAQKRIVTWHKTSDFQPLRRYT